MQTELLLQHFEPVRDISAHDGHEHYSVFTLESSHQYGCCDQPNHYHAEPLIDAAGHPEDCVCSEHAHHESALLEIDHGCSRGNCAHQHHTTAHRQVDDGIATAEHTTVKAMMTQIQLKKSSHHHEHGVGNCCKMTYGDSVAYIDKTTLLQPETAVLLAAVRDRFAGYDSMIAKSISAGVEPGVKNRHAHEKRVSPFQADTTDQFSIVRKGVDTDKSSVEREAGANKVQSVRSVQIESPRRSEPAALDNDQVRVDFDRRQVLPSVMAVTSPAIWYEATASYHTSEASRETPEDDSPDYTHDDMIPEYSQHGSEQLNLSAIMTINSQTAKPKTLWSEPESINPVVIQDSNEIAELQSLVYFDETGDKRPVGNTLETTGHPLAKQLSQTVILLDRLQPITGVQANELQNRGLPMLPITEYHMSPTAVRQAGADITNNWSEYILERRQAGMYREYNLQAGAGGMSTKVYQLTPPAIVGSLVLRLLAKIRQIQLIPAT